MHCQNRSKTPSRAGVRTAAGSFIAPPPRLAAGLLALMLTAGLTSAAAAVPVAPAGARGAVAAAASHQPALAALGERELDGLLVALDREYRLAAIYRRAIGEFGGHPELAAAAGVERQRLARLRTVYRAHGLSFPNNPWEQRLGRFANPEQACLAAYRAELELDGTLERLSATADAGDLVATYRTARAGADHGSWLTALRDCALRAAV